MNEDISFKPYYKWITFNTMAVQFINYADRGSFKPYYKWITFNTANVDRFRLDCGLKF